MAASEKEQILWLCKLGMVCAFAVGFGFAALLIHLMGGL
jgi:hypothetical protein